MSTATELSRQRRSPAEQAALMVAKSDTGRIAGLMRGILEPLCPETAKMLTAHAIRSNDRLGMRLSEDGMRFIVKPFALLDGQVVSASGIARRKWLEYVPECEELRNDQWELAATDITALVVNATWDESQIVFADEEVKMTYSFLLARFMGQTVASQQRALYKLRGEMPEMPADWMDHPDRPLAPYQKVAAITSLGQECSALYAEQGTGKTPIAIAKVCLQARRFQQQRQGPKQLYRVLIVAPKNVRHNWQNEFGQFATTPGKVTVLHGGRHERTSLIIETIAVEAGDDSEYGVCICSYETLRRSWDEIRAIPWHLVIADEGHYMKGWYTERWKVLKQLSSISRERLELTGTPICNSVLDLYTQLEFLAPGMSGFSSFNAFRKFYGVFVKSEDGQREKLIDVQNLPFLQERIARLAFIITKKEALPNLPGKLRDVRTVEMTKRQRQRYIDLQSQLALEIEAGQETKTMTAQHILVKLLRLAQITSGFYAWDAQLDPMTGDVIQARQIEYELPNPKLEQFIEDVKASADDEKVICWACFIPDIELIARRLEAESIPFVRYTGTTSDEDRAEAERRFNCLHARECKVFLGNPAAGGTGLNLRGYDPSVMVEERGLALRPKTWRSPIERAGERLRQVEPLPGDHGCDCTLVCYYSQGWSMVHRSQSEDRAHRRGTRRPVTYRDYVVAGTIDEEIRCRVVLKQTNAFTVQDVRDIMERVLSMVPETEE